MFWRAKTYEELPALAVRGSQLRHALRTTTLAWAFGITWMTCIGGSRINVFGRMIGFSDLHFGLLASVPFLARPGQLLATILIERTGLRKWQFIQCASISRLMWFGVAAVPLISLIPGVPPLPASWAVFMVLSLLIVSAVGDALAAPAWVNWMGDVIPRRIRGRYMATRSRVTQLARLPVVIGLAVYLDWLTIEDAHMNIESQPLLLWAICGIFAFAAAMGTIDILLFLPLREVVPSTGDKPRQSAVQIHVPRRPDAGPIGRAIHPLRVVGAGFNELVARPMADRTFRRYVLLGATATFAMTVAGPFFWRNCLEHLRFSQLATDMLFMVIGPLFGVLAARPLGRLLDRWGRRPVMMLCLGLTCCSVLPYFVASPQNTNPPLVAPAVNAVWSAGRELVGLGPGELLGPKAPVGAWLIMVNSMMLGGIGWSGFGLAQQNIMFGFADGPGRSKYVAGYMVLGGIGGFLGGYVGGTVAEMFSWLRADPIVIGRVVYNNWHVTFVLSLLARLAALLQTINMPDPGSRRARDMFLEIRAGMYNYLRPRIFTLPRGWVRRNRDR